MKRRASIVAVSAALAACAAQAPQAPVDDSPANPTAVVETLVVNGGIGGMFPFEMTQKHYVRANMRRDDHSLKGTGTFSGYLMTSMAGGADSGITRLDRDKHWSLNHRKKEYVECPAHGCPAASAEEKQKPEEARQEPKQQTEKGCTMHIAHASFEVKPTGEKRAINGFDASQYQAAWTVKLQDPQRRTTTSTLSFDVWTTPLTATMREAMGVEQTYAKAYLAGAPHARVAGLHEGGEVMPAQVTRMMQAYLASLRPADRATFANAGKQLAKIQGHPVYTHIEWRLDGDACGAKDESASASAQPSMGSMLSSVSGMFGKKESAGPKPILAFTIEVKSLKMEPVRDSVFAVPAGYKRLEQ